MKKAYLFPGQGTQYVGMGKDFFDTFLVARETFLEADEILGEPLSQRIFEGPQEVLLQTSQAQLAIFVTSMAVFRTVQQLYPNLEPTVCAGLSLGEYTALCASGKLDFKQTLFVVQKRAELMHEACETRKGFMAAVFGLRGEEIEQIIREIKGVWIANFNAPDQIVLSGTKEGIAAAESSLKKAGAKRVVFLNVHGAFHSMFMQSAQDGLIPMIQALNFSKSGVDLVMNVTGDLVHTDAQIRKNLTEQITQSVRWEQGIATMQRLGVEFFLEIGCGKTLNGLNRKMGISSTRSIDTIEDLEFMHAAT